MMDMKSDKIMSKQLDIDNHQFHAFHKEHNLGIFVIIMLLTALSYALVERHRKINFKQQTYINTYRRL